MIDIANLKVSTKLPLGGYPVGLVLSPSHDRVYVSDYSSDVVWVIDTRSLKVLATVTVVPSPGNMALTPDGSFLYVLSLSSGAISVVDTETNAAVQTITVPTQLLLSIAITPDGRFAYATDCCSDNNVTVIDTHTNSVTTQIPLAGGPSGIAITPNGRFAFVEDSADVSVIDVRENAVAATIPGIGGCGPVVALNPDASLAYVENYCGNSIAVVDTHTWTTVTSWTTNTPIGMAFTAGGAFGFVLNNNCPAFPCTVPGTVSVTDTANDTVAATVTVGSNPQAIAIAPEVRHPPAEPAAYDGVGQHATPRASSLCPVCR